MSAIMRATGSTLAVTAACAVLFGGSFTTARLTREGEHERVAPRPEAPPAVLPDTELALGPSAPDLPGLRRQARPKPRPEPAAPAAPSAPAPASPAPVAPSEPSPQPVSDPSPAPPSPSPPSQPTPSAPSEPASEPPSEVEFYDSGG